MCRSILGLHKRSQVTAKRDELGTYPFGIDIVTNIIQFTKYLQKEWGLHCISSLEA